jgi:phage terminase Nu1 subunit (DNA packaging protein)
MAAQTFPLDTIAKLLVLTPRRVNQLVGEGIIPRAERGRYELVPAVQGYVKYLREKAIRGDISDDYANHRTRLLKARADMAEMEQAQLENKLIPSADVEKAWGEVLNACRSKLLSVPTKTATEVFAAESLNEVKAILKQGIYEAINELSSVHVETVNPIRVSEPSEGDTEDDEPLEATARTKHQRVGRPRTQTLS